METKPYRIQSPEAIAKDYGGNKQKIAEAMQLGVIDPTAGVLAGMFIDRMRSAQVQEMAPQATVAQQVMGGAPQAPASPPPGGLGATAPAQPPMAPMGAPAPEAIVDNSLEDEITPSMAAGGLYEAPYMAGGGLSELPVPDGMFDEDRSGSYAGGGIIAFAGGSPGAYGDVIEETALSLFPNLQVTSRQRSAAKNAAVKGVPGSYHLTGDARDFKPSKGMSTKSLAAALKSKFGSNFDVIDEGDHVHVEPSGKSGARASFPERNTQSSSGRALSLRDQIRGAQEIFGELPDSGLDEAEEYYRKQLSPEEKKKSRKYDMWSTLAEIGASMASTKSPQFLQAAGQAMAAALPGAAASKKERDKAERDAVNALADIAGMRRKEAKEVLEFGKDAYTAELGAEQAQRVLNFQERELASQIEQRGLDRASAEKIAGMRTSNPSQFETIMGIIMSGTPEAKNALKEYFKMTKPPAGTGNMFGVNTGEGGEAAGPWSQYQ